MGELLRAAIAAAEERWAVSIEVGRRACLDDCEQFLGPDLVQDMGIEVDFTAGAWYGAFYWVLFEWRLWRSPGGRWRLAQMVPGSDRSLLNVPVADRDDLLIELADAAEGTPEDGPRPTEERLVELIRAMVREEMGNA